MTHATKQQEFLDNLKDPIKVQLKAAVRYYQTFNNDIRIVFVEDDSEKYVIDIMANTFAAMAGSTEDFDMMLEKIIDKPAYLGQLSRAADHPYRYRRSFFIWKHV